MKAYFTIRKRDKIAWQSFFNLSDIFIYLTWESYQRAETTKICVFLKKPEIRQLTTWKKQQFRFIKRFDKGWITTVKDLESRRFER